MKRLAFSAIISLFIIVLCSFPDAGLAAPKEISNEQGKVELLIGNPDADKGLLVGIHFLLEDGWKVYWKEPGDSGFPPETTWSSNDNPITATHTLWPAPTRFVDRFDEVVSESYGYKHEVVFPTYLTLEDTARPATIDTQLRYAICREICIPYDITLSAVYTPGRTDELNQATINRYLGQVPAPEDVSDIKIKSVSILKAEEGNYLELELSSDSPFTENPDIFVSGSEDFTFTQPQLVSMQTDGLGITLRTLFQPITLQAEESLAFFRHSLFEVVITDGKRALSATLKGADIKEIHQAPPPLATQPASSLQWLTMLFFAFVGGMILNVMPCVLPVLSLKLLGVLKHGNSDTAYIRRSLLSVILGILTSFLALALIVIALKTTGRAAGWGFHFQEPFFLISLCLVLIFFTANLWGFFHISLPPALAARLAGNGKWDEGHLAHFLSGAFATLLATPCTAPFLGTAVGFALAQASAFILLFFIVMGLGLSVPYLLLIISPALIRFIPKPGNWMNKVKAILGVFLIATVLWLVWVLAAQLGHRAAYALLVLLAGLLVSLTHWFWRNPRFRFGFIWVVIALTFTTPFDLAGKRTMADAPIADIWMPFEEDVINGLVADGMTVFVDITAEWCLTCKANKLLVLSREEVHSALSAPEVIAMKGDWTSRNDDIARYLAMHKRSGIPFNIVYGPGAPEGIVLSELLSTQEVLDAIEKAGKSQ